MCANVFLDLFFCVPCMFQSILRLCTWTHMAQVWRYSFVTDNEKIYTSIMGKYVLLLDMPLHTTNISYVSPAARTRESSAQPGAMVSVWPSWQQQLQLCWPS